jgi:hypothetical protein
MSIAPDIDLDTLIDRLLERAAERAGPVLNVTGEDITGLAAAGRVVVNPGDIVASDWGNLVYGQSVNVFASAADRDTQWPTPPDGAICYTQAEPALWVRRAGQWAPMGSSGQAPVAAGAAFTTATDWAGEVWVAKGGVNGGAWRKARDVLRAKVYRAAAASVSQATSFSFGWDTAAEDPFGMLAASPTYPSGQVTIAVAGQYLVTAQVRLNTTANAATQYSIQLLKNGTQFKVATATAGSFAAVGAQAVPISSIMTLAAGDTVTAQALLVGSTSPLVVGPTGNFLELAYLGTG